ncbi:MAG: hypothetical protein JNL43_10715 [Flavobacteriales bacterium]|nr:hypothetical protein [Flavobacteriales bacterium]
MTVSPSSLRTCLLIVAGLTALLTWLGWNLNAHYGVIVLTHKSDPLGYYQFLPGVLLHGDWMHLSYTETLDNGNKLSLYTIGVAVLRAPFFLLATGWSYLIGDEPTGFGLPYYFVHFLGASLYCSTGLVLLLRVLQRKGSTGIAAITIVLLLFGTNLYFYTVHEAGMSHVYSFFLFAWLLYLTVSMLERPRSSTLLALFFCGGLILLVRPLNGIALLIPVLYGSAPLEAIRLRLKWVTALPRSTVIGVLIALAVVAPQLLYWYQVTGNWLVFTYGTKGQGFNWGSPHLWDILFSHQGGWLLYTPIMIGAVAVLLWQAWRNVPGARTILLVLGLAWYIYASWWSWWLGGSFGHRGFVEHYALLALPFSSFVQSAAQWAGPRKRNLLIPAGILVFLNIRMSLLAFSPMDGPTWTWDSLLDFWARAFFMTG